MHRPLDLGPTATNHTSPGLDGEQSAQTLFNPTGDVTKDAFLDVIEGTASPFLNAPPAEQGTLGEISNTLNATLALVALPFQLLDTGVALLTAKFAANFAAQPAAVLGAPHIGLPHGHFHPPSQFPPAPPIPLPSIGTVMAAGAVSTLICGTPAARAADVGLAPTCCGFTPAFEVFTGSSQVFIGGSRAARIGDITRHCMKASAMGAFGAALGALGVAAGAVGAAAVGSGENANPNLANAMAQQAAADAAALALSLLLGKDKAFPFGSVGKLVSGQPTVLIGGFPMPDLLEIIGGLRKLAKILSNGVSGGIRNGSLFCLPCV